MTDGEIEAALAALEKECGELAAAVAEWPEKHPGPQGPTGPQGSRGPTGPRGPTGAKGPVGPKGPRGPNGMTGPVGPKGPSPRGPKGPQGATGATGSNGPVGPTGLAGSPSPEYSPRPLYHEHHWVAGSHTDNSIGKAWEKPNNTLVSFSASGADVSATGLSMSATGVSLEFYGTVTSVTVVGGYMYGISNKNFGFETKGVALRNVLNPFKTYAGGGQSRQSVNRGDTEVNRNDVDLNHNE